MAITRSILHIRESTTLELWYGKRNPALGTYYGSADITACTVAVYDSAGTELLAPTAMTLVANLRGYRYSWVYGSALDGKDIAYAFFSPTRAASVAAALAPDEIVPLDLSDVNKELAEAEATLRDKTGYKLAADGLDLVVPADPAAIPVLGTSSIVVWLGFFGAESINEWNVDNASARLKNSAGTANLATFAHSDSGTLFQSEEPT